jgi:hypothetical protein|tara:strand:+ start:15255 stop:15770 length:516 start_codon:yes stop_codon:yes gene_type:complete
MSWKTIGRTMLRAMLDDPSSTTYTDSRLDSLLITSAYFLPIEINFVTNYTVDIVAEAIAPDPASALDGVDFIALMVLKAACMADTGSFRTRALIQGVSASLGPASLQTGGYGAQLLNLLNLGPCKAYEELKEQYNFSYKGKQVIRAIMGPFVSNDFNPSAQRGHFEADTIL